jgi:hypothetical protein
MFGGRKKSKFPWIDLSKEDAPSNVDDRSAKRTACNPTRQTLKTLFSVIHRFRLSDFKVRTAQSPNR